MPVNSCQWSFLASCIGFQGSIDVISQALPASHKTLPPLDFPEFLLALHGWIRWFQSRMVMNWDLGACQQPLYAIIVGTMSIPLVWKVWSTLLNEESLGISKDLTHTRVSRVRYYDNTMIIVSPFAQDWSNNTTKPELPLNKTPGCTFPNLSLSTNPPNVATLPGPPCLPSDG